jgi:hypothetical protein
MSELSSEARKGPLFLNSAAQVRGYERNAALVAA